MTERPTPYKGKCDDQWLQGCPEILSWWSCAEAADFIKCLLVLRIIYCHVHGPSASRIPWRMIVWDGPIAMIFFPFLVIWKGVKKHLKIASLQFHRYHSDHELGYSHFQWYRKTGFLWCLFYNLKPSSFHRLGADDWWRSHPVQFHDQTEDTEFFFSNIELCQL